jgi:hypothetical protein
MTTVMVAPCSPWIYLANWYMFRPSTTIPANSTKYRIVFSGKPECPAPLFNPHYFSGKHFGDHLSSNFDVSLAWLSCRTKKSRTRVQVNIYNLEELFKNMSLADEDYGHLYSLTAFYACIIANLQHIREDWRPVVVFKTRADYVAEGHEDEIDDETLKAWKAEVATDAQRTDEQQVADAQ